MTEWSIDQALEQMGRRLEVPVRHRVTVAFAHDVNGPAEGWQALCSCGWVGDQRADVASAGVDADRHSGAS